MIQTLQRNSILLAVGFLTLFTSHSSAFEITAVGGLNYAAPTQRTNGIDIHQTGNATATFGILLAANLFDSRFDFEVGALNQFHQSERDNTVPLVTQRLQFLEVPLVFRYRLDESIAIGFGGYVGFALGNVQTTQNGITTETPYEMLFWNKTDYGLVANLRARFALAPPLYFILDARYQHGLANLAQMPNDLLNTRSIQVMAGLTYEFPSTPSQAGLN